MLTLFGKRQSFCDGIKRRSFLKIGALGVGSLGAAGLGLGNLTLADILRAESTMPAGQAKPKSIINIFLSGGPPHTDIFDLKPDAPPEIRGEFRPIPTTVPGMDICQLLPRLAKLGKKFALVRSLTGFQNEHGPQQTESGWNENDLKSIGGRPSLGCAVAKLRGPSSGVVPTFVDISGYSRHGFLGPAYSAFRPQAEGGGDLRLRPEITADRFHNRLELLGQLDHIRRDIDASHTMDAMDSFNQRAVDVVTSSKLAEALDWGKAGQRSLDSYGIPQRRENSDFLVARRLVECGVRIVSFGVANWDTHGQNFPTLRRQLPWLDAGLSALLEDLDSSGLLDSTAVIMWGEFGRSPRINLDAGREHWPQASCAFVAGGGMRTGQVIGSTNRYGEVPQDRPVQLQEVFATLYHLLGIDPKTTTLRDPNGRPQYLVAHPDPIQELVG